MSIVMDRTAEMVLQPDTVKSCSNCKNKKIKVSVGTQRCGVGGGIGVE